MEPLLFVMARDAEAESIKSIVLSKYLSRALVYIDTHLRWFDPQVPSRNFYRQARSRAATVARWSPSLTLCPHHGGILIYGPCNVPVLSQLAEGSIKPEYQDWSNRPVCLWAAPQDSAHAKLNTRLHLTSNLPPHGLPPAEVIWT